MDTKDLRGKSPFSLLIFSHRFIFPFLLSPGEILRTVGLGAGKQESYSNIFWFRRPAKERPSGICLSLLIQVSSEKFGIKALSGNTAWTLSSHFFLSQGPGWGSLSLSRQVLESLEFSFTFVYLFLRHTLVSLYRLSWEYPQEKSATQGLRLLHGERLLMVSFQGIPGAGWLLGNAQHAAGHIWVLRKDDMLSRCGLLMISCSCISL